MSLRFGFLGAGGIASRVASAFPFASSARIVAVGSRDLGRARAFAAREGVSRAYGSYEELVADPQVDVVYIATPNAFHFEHARLALEAEKHALVEKPFTVNAEEARTLVALARSKGLFLMEAMWTRFFPATREVRRWISEGAIGSVRLVEACFGFRASAEELPPLLSKDLAVGSLLDVGVYPISLAHMAFGCAPARVSGFAELSSNGVDQHAAFVLGFDGGGLALGSSAVTHDTPHDSWVCGTEGRIHLDAPFWSPSRVTLVRPGATELVFDRLSRGNGFEHELEAVAAAIREGKTEHPELPLDESIEIMQTLDRLRAHLGIEFPADRPAPARLAVVEPPRTSG
ncbi:MAG: Gfo/Idh/MocA family oxidoreductase [Deltaproteobacteria bacterium]|nr:Gfo/Idh/MocA family oxidoreductase [Deltaproteobacteria bacterium]